MRKRAVSFCVDGGKRLVVWAFLDFGQVQLDNFGRKNSSVKGQSYVPSGGRFTHMSTLDEKDEV